MHPIHVVARKMGMATLTAKLLEGTLLGCLALTACSLSAAVDSTPDTNSIPLILLIAPTDSTPIDAQIRATQTRMSRSVKPAADLERLGWLFIAKARASSDPGFNTLAAMAADTLEQKLGHPKQAWLLRGHVLHTRHRFAEAEELGRKLVAARGAPADFALLGDALYDRGRIDEAAEAYQRMVDLKPGLDSYARAANIRFVKGDLEGAIELQTLAVRSGGRGDAGAMAWSVVRLAQLVWQRGDLEQADALVNRALELVPEFQPALLLQGRMLLAAGRAVEALAPLARAAEIMPLPEPRWVYAEALRAAGRNDEAATAEDRLVREGIAEDPRTVAIFLATHGGDSSVAVRLASDELSYRADSMTHAANGLALATAGRIEEAVAHSRAALSEGTVDARLLLYAGRTAALARQAEEEDLLQRASKLAGQLLPSERKLLEDTLALLSTGNTYETNQPTTS